VYVIPDLCRFTSVKRTYALIAVGAALMADASARHWGYDLSKRSGIRSGVMYPTLQRMLNEGWLADGWEDQAQVGRGKRPPRRYYELTDKGKIELGALLAAARRDPRFARVIGGLIVQGVMG
jgi:PadR family transcriptional regulator, regulatory protein PadR